MRTNLYLVISLFWINAVFGQVIVHCKDGKTYNVGSPEKSPEQIGKAKCEKNQGFEKWVVEAGVNPGMPMPIPTPSQESKKR